MPAFNDLAGIPMTANAQLIKGWLRRRLGFNGVIVSDYNAVAELMRHGIAADLAQAAALALNAGVDIDMMAGAYRQGLPIALDRGWVRSADIDESVRRVLTLKWKLGLFDDPYRRGRTAESADALSARRRFARAVGARAIVMLKNGRGVLPLPSGARLAVLGPLADAVGEMRGPWWGAAGPEGHVTVAAGFRAALPEGQVLYAPGVNIDGNDISGLDRALELCARTDAVILCLGETATMSGEAASRAHPHLPGRQRQFAESVFERARALGKPAIAVLFSGRPLIVPWLAERADAVLAAWFLGSEAGNSIADVILGRVSPSGSAVHEGPSATASSPRDWSWRGLAVRTVSSSARRPEWWAWSPTPPTGTSPTGTSSSPRSARRPWASLATGWPPTSPACRAGTAIRPWRAAG